MEKQEIQDEKTSTEEKQPEATETPQPTIEELQKELEKAKNQANTYQGLLKQAQQKSISRDDLQPIFERIDGQQRWIASALDDFRNTEGEYGEKARKTYSADAEEHITKSNEARKPTQDPIAEKFFEYLKDEELVFEDDFVQDTIKDTQNPSEALKAIKTKVKERNEAKIRTDLKAEMATEGQQMLEKKLKDMGLLDRGPEGPSASSRDLSSMTPDEKLQEGFKQAKKKQ